MRARAYGHGQDFIWSKPPGKKKKAGKKGLGSKRREIHNRSRGCVVEVRDRATPASDRGGRGPASLEKNRWREREEGARDEETKSEVALEEAARERDRATAAWRARRDGPLMAPAAMELVAADKGTRDSVVCDLNCTVVHVEVGMAQVMGNASLRHMRVV